MEIHFYYGLEEAFGLQGKVYVTISVNKIIKNTRLYSVLTLSVKENISPYLLLVEGLFIGVNKSKETGWYIMAAQQSAVSGFSVPPLKE